MKLKKAFPILLVLAGALFVGGGLLIFWKLSAPRTVLLVGDCITRGYAEPLCAKLGARYVVWHVPRGTGTICNLLSHLENRVISQGPDIIVMNVGLHDVTTNGSAIGPRCTVKQYREAVAGLLALLQKHTRARLIWTTCTPCIDRITRTIRSNADIDIINAVGVDEARKAGVEIIDLNATVRSSLEELSRDGTHFTPEGYRVLAWTIARTIREG